MGEDSLASDNALVRVETTVNHLGGKVESLHGKADEIVEGLNNFKVEVTSGFGATNALIERLDERIASHVRQDERSFDQHRAYIDEIRRDVGAVATTATTAHRIASEANPPTKTRMAIGVGGAGALSALLITFLDWLAKHFGSVPPTN